MKKKDIASASKPRRPFRRKLLLLACACVLSLLAGELLTRLLLEPPEYVEVLGSAGDTERPTAENHEKEVMHVRAMPRDGELYVITPAGRRLRANTEAVIHNHRLSHRDITITTNSIGYRNRELGPKQETRVLFLGDSLVFGDYLDEPETFVRLVEKLSGEKPRPLETINAGVGGIGLEDELAILVESGLGTDPDVVVLCFYINDVEHSPGVRLINAPRLLASSHLVQHFYRALSVWSAPASDSSMEVISPETLEEWRTEVRRRFPPGQADIWTDPTGFNSVIHAAFPDWGVAWSDGAWERMRPTFYELRRLSRINGFQLLFVAFPVTPQVVVDYVYDYPQQKLADVATELGVPLLDLLPLLRKAHRETGEKLFFDLCHHTAYGSRLIAEWILAFLDEHVK